MIFNSSLLSSIPSFFFNGYVCPMLLSLLPMDNKLVDFPIEVLVTWHFTSVTTFRVK